MPTVAIHRQRRALRLSVVLDDAERRARFAYAVRYWRLKRGLTPPKLAKLVDVAPKTINKWEDGEQMPSILMLGPLCDALSVDADLFAVLPPVPDYEGATYLMDEEPDPSADRVARAVVDGEVPPEQDEDGESDDPAKRARAQS